MAEIVNLRMARKGRKRSEAETAAAANRAKFGESKASRAVRRIDSDREARHIDGAKREDTE